jgi:chromosome segregation ATPase
MEHQQSFEKVKGWPGWERIGETCNKVAMLEATLTRLVETVKSLDGQTQVLTAKVANLNPISAADVQREVQKAETHSRQYVEARLREIEQHIKVSSGNQETQLPPEVTQKLAQLEDHLDHVEKQLAKEREEFAKTLGATRLRTYEKEKTFEAQIARLKKPDLPGCDERRKP